MFQHVAAGESTTFDFTVTSYGGFNSDIDLFVTDVVMPGMDGPAWVRRAHLDRPEVKVVFMSGYAEDGLAEDQARVPNSVFLPKPFSLTDLTTTVQGLLS